MREPITAITGIFILFIEDSIWDKLLPVKIVKEAYNLGDAATDFPDSRGQQGMIVYYHPNELPYIVEEGVIE